LALVECPETAQNVCDERVAGWSREKVTPAEFRQKEKIGYLLDPNVRVQ
jgi:hypothetical protein